MKANKLLISIIILLLLIIILIIAILLLNNSNIKKHDDNPSTIAFEQTEKIGNKSLFYNIDANIKKYIEYSYKKNTNAMNSISSGKLSIENKSNYHSVEMYILDKISNITVFVHGVTRDTKEENHYMVVKLDYSNNAFSIENSNRQEYENAVNNILDNKDKQDVTIQKNEYNEIVSRNITDFEILGIYFEDYKYKAINNVELAFNLLNSEYKSKKFNNDINLYKEYVQKNDNRFTNANIVKHGITKEGQFAKYICIDNYNNYYEFYETGIGEYTVILDNYTLETDDFTNKYNKLSDKEKAISNVDKVIKLINEKNYTQLYEYLNIEFKKRYFKNQAEFEKYMQNNFFDNNIVGTLTIKNEGNIFTIEVPYKEGLSSAAEQRTKTFIVKLKEGTDFELSFNVD